MTAHDEDEWLDVELATGNASPASGADDDDEYPVGTLWLPNPDARRGWEMRHVWRKPAPSEERRIGFRRR